MQRLIAVVAGVLLLAPQAPRGGRTLQPGTAAILGRLVEAGSAIAVDDALVTLGGPALGSTADTFANGTAGGARHVYTDRQGQFVFWGLPAGSYTLTTEAAGYIAGGYGESGPRRAVARTLDVERTLDLADGDRILDLTIQLWKMAGLAGTVTDEAGEPVVAAPVTVLTRTVDWAGTVMQTQTTVLTDDRGAYHADVPPSNYIVGILAATTTAPLSAVDEFQRVMTEGGAAQSAYLNRVTTTGGLLPRGYGTRLGDLIVSQMNNRNSPVVPPFTKRDGRLWFYPSTFHPSSLAPSSAAIVSLESGVEKAGIDIRLRPTPLVRISGRVIGPDDAISNLGLRLVAADASVGRTSPATMIDAPMAGSDARGEFAFVGVVPGTYTLRAVRRPADHLAPLYWSAETVTVGDVDLADVRVTLQRGAHLGGRIVFEGAASEPAASAIRAITVTPLPWPGTAPALQTVIAGERVDDQGHFRTAELVPGPYTIRVSGVPAGWTVKSVTTKGHDAIDSAFDCPPAGLDDLVVTLTDRVSTVSGTVRGAAGQPTSAPVVLMFPVDRTLWRQPGTVSRRVQTTAPNRAGRYQFVGLPSGDYFIVAVDVADTDLSDPQVLASFISVAQRVTVADGDVRTVDLRVEVRR